MKLKALVGIIFFSVFTIQQSSAQNSNKIVDSNCEFGFDIFKKISETEKSNIFISPISINVAMTMAYIGADLKTAEEIKTALHFSGKQQDLHEYLNSLLAHYRKTTNLGFKISNAAVMQEAYKFNETYINMLKDYDAKISIGNFIDEVQKQKVKNEINDWVSDNTEGKIEKLLEDSDLNTQTRLVLLNAIYFKNSWMFPFDVNRTQIMPFNVKKYKQVDTDFMFSEATCQYYKDQELEVIVLPYKDNNASFYIIMPENIKKFEKFCSNFDNRQFNEIEEHVRKAKIDLYMPKFQIKSKYKLKEYLQTLGIKEAFSDNADFSKMTDTKNLKIDNIIHQSFIEVDEVGTEAGASTAVVMREKSAAVNKLKVKVDRPFIFIIKENSQNQILFIGKYRQPE
jgi:serpin B